MSGHAVADIRNTYGCIFIGLIVSVMLFGITTLQTWIYYWQYGNRDQKALKLFIAVIFLLDALHTTLCICSVYWYLVLNFGNVEILDTSFWFNSTSTRSSIIWFNSTMPDEFTLVSIIILNWNSKLQPGFLSVGGSIVIPIIIVIFGTASFALGLVFTITVTTLKWSRYASIISITNIGLGSAVVTDILIAVSMCWFLYHKRTGFARTDSVIMTLMTYSVHTGLLTSVLTCAVLISFAIAPSTMYSDMLFWPMSKLYANSLLAMLNSRDYVRGRSSTDNEPENAFDLSSIRIEQRSEGDYSRQPTVSVTVHRSATTDFPQCKRDHDVESSTVENSKLVWSLHFSVATTALILILSFEGGEYSF
ncbi:hypothetical protein EDB89DRAFT_2239062 [Lactarius sanguifluus]|nr:hypothetical protein EDB89DRAFT_2239062 [Lactarius sanguifluus]